MSEKYTYIQQTSEIKTILKDDEFLGAVISGSAITITNELNALHARVQELEAENAVLTERAHDALANAVEHENKLQELEAENKKLREARTDTLQDIAKTSKEQLSVQREMLTVLKHILDVVKKIFNRD